MSLAVLVSKWGQNCGRNSVRGIVRAFSTTRHASDTEVSSGLEYLIESKGVNLKGAPMYLDMQSTTPIRPPVRVADVP